MNNLKKFHWSASLRGLGPLIGVLIVVASLPRLTFGQNDQETKPTQSLKKMSLEDLMNIDVSSVSRKKQKLSEAAAAVYVLTAEDIRRSGATSIPEVLRFVPGMQVAQIDNNEWAVSARGFNGKYASNMLVMIDGRSIYTDLFNGVYWEQNDVALDDIERIEIIRGPGGALWGANAVNGVINIITKKAKDTQGGLLSARYGNQERGDGTARYGGSDGDNIQYRGTVSGFSRAPEEALEGGSAYDQWQSIRGSGRVDLTLSNRDTLTFEGDLYRENMGETVYPNWPLSSLSPPADGKIAAHGGYDLERWERKLSETSSLALQGSFTDEYRNEFAGLFSRREFDVDFQYRLSLAPRNDVIWGAGYRLDSDHIVAGSTVEFLPASRKDSLYSFFFQDDITIVPHRVVLTVGSKFQHNDFTGFEVQPSARMLVHLGERSSVWASASRAVSTPSLLDQDVQISFQTGIPGVMGRISGHPQAVSETLIAYEVGFRQQWQKFDVDLAAFYNTYNKVLVLTPETPFLELSPQPVLIAPEVSGNGGAAFSKGLDGSLNTSLKPGWEVSGTYSYINLDSRQGIGVQIGSLGGIQAGNARNRFSIRSKLDLPQRWEWDVTLYYVSSLDNGIPSYTRLDTRLGWHLNRHAEVDLVGQNLLEAQHVEFFTEDYVRSSEIKRSGYLELKFPF